jgi:hypothetical protein
MKEAKPSPAHGKPGKRALTNCGALVVCLLFAGVNTWVVYVAAGAICPSPHGAPMSRHNQLPQAKRSVAIRPVAGFAPFGGTAVSGI